MKLDEFMNGRSFLYLPLVDDGVSVEVGASGVTSATLVGKSEPIIVTQGEGAENVLIRLFTANAAKTLSHLVELIVNARTHELWYRANAKPMPAITLDEIECDMPLPELPVSLHVNDHAEQCDCGVKMEARLDWAGKWAGRVGGLSWTEVRGTDDLRYVLRELLNASSPMILDAMIDDVVTAQHDGLPAAHTGPVRQDNDTIMGMVPTQATEE